MFLLDIDLESKEPIYKQIVDQIITMIEEGTLTSGSKLPSTRELSLILKLSRNSCIHAYEELEAREYISIIKGKGAFVSNVQKHLNRGWNIAWKKQCSDYAKRAVELDIIKSEPVTKKGMISFKSIAPDEKLFDLEQVRRNFLNGIALEGEKLLNYGYAKGYRPLIEYLEIYLKDKGICLEGKDILITNGFTEAFDIILASITKPLDSIICENPTHNTAIKIIKLHELNIASVSMENGEINVEELEKALSSGNNKLVYLIPSYHNPMGTVMSASKRKEVYELCKKYNTPIVEDGFNEELLYSSSHVSSIAAVAGMDNGVIYLGSFSKVLFPGIRVGWIVADKGLIEVLESVKRSRNIHTSVLDQMLLYQFLKSGDFELYMKKTRKFYREKYEFSIECSKRYLPHSRIYGEGGLYIFIELVDIDSRVLLKRAMEKGVIFMPGDIFFVNEKGRNTFRLGFSRLSLKDIEKGFRIIGKCIEDIKANK
ncbi:PLP-dependent aminotransferase family protein [Clostridium omnivorum]|uniref:GntR family transcriptional regulator n=1 Tax=Clostridium omnivorum TaxID=1604902 RepID=A0ABQ5N732_9CLOT|nr:PLP-dependent aminotransferase family protein [Clostridium sp. E14]GLC30936.1 GntR family transcriptional regulator [Clostridium sp. E14]